MPWAVGALVATVVLSGCQAEETPPTGASPSASSGGASASPSPTSPSPSASPSSEVPAAAREKSEAGAKAFARFFMVQAAEAWTVPNPALIEHHSSSECDACNELARVAAELRVNGERYDKPPVTLTKLSTIRKSENAYAFDAQLRENAVHVIGRSGEVVDTYPSRQISRAIAVTWEEGRWLLDGIGE